MEVRDYFLGHEVSSKDVNMEQNKMRAMKDWPALNDAFEVCSFLGLAG